MKRQAEPRKPIAESGAQLLERFLQQTLVVRLPRLEPGSVVVLREVAQELDPVLGESGEGAGLAHGTAIVPMLDPLINGKEPELDRYGASIGPAQCRRHDRQPPAATRGPTRGGGTCPAWRPSAPLSRPAFVPARRRSELGGDFADRDLERRTGAGHGHHRGSDHDRAEPRKEDPQSGEDSSATIERSIEFDVRDDSGRIHVMPHAAQWDVRMRDMQPEARLEDGDRVTVVGSALPFGQLQDPGSADWLTPDDPVIAADLEAARAAGELEPDPSRRYGNLGIPGFALGRPESPPTLDPGVPTPAVYQHAPAPQEASRPEPAARPAAGIAAEEAPAASFAPTPETLVLAAVPGSDLLIAEGDPASAASLDQWEFLAGLAGAVLAIGGAVLLALTVEGWLA